VDIVGRVCGTLEGRAMTYAMLWVEQVGASAQIESHNLVQEAKSLLAVRCPIFILVCNARKILSRNYMRHLTTGDTL